VLSRIHYRTGLDTNAGILSAMPLHRGDPDPEFVSVFVAAIARSRWMRRVSSPVSCSSLARSDSVLMNGLAIRSFEDPRQLKPLLAP
jgi:hypothetical protein